MIQIESCPQCGFKFMDQQPVVIQQGFCPRYLRWEIIKIVHAGICWEDHLAGMPTAYTQNRLAGARRLN